MKEGRDRPDRHTLNPHPMPFRSTGRSALLLLIASPLLLSAAPQDLRDFEAYVFFDQFVMIVSHFFVPQSRHPCSIQVAALDFNLPQV